MNRILSAKVCQSKLKPLRISCLAENRVYAEHENLVDSLKVSVFGKSEGDLLTHANGLCQ